MRKAVEEYKRREPIRFHMPGHSGVDIDGGLYRVAPDDITELDWSDNLAHPTGDIKALEERLARIYGTRRAFMLTQGATTGIEVALLIAREMRDTLYVLGETHKSCVSFASVIGLRLVMLDSMQDAIARVSEGAFVYVTSPDYYGNVLDMDALLDARNEGGAVIVDEAHGAHYVFSELLPENLAHRANITVESLHKTLPVFTGGAVLCVSDERFTSMAEYFKCKIHSTSPSYLIMQSIERAMDIMEKDGERLYREVYERVKDFAAHLDARYRVLETADFSRVVIECGDAESVAHYLEERDIYLELFDERRLVLIVTPWNSEHLTRLGEVLGAYNGTEIEVREENIPTFRLKRARGVQGRLRFVQIDESAGYVSMSEIAVYPPGVPVVATGDIITSEVIAYIDANRERIVGLVGDTIGVRELCEEN